MEAISRKSSSLTQNWKGRKSRVLHANFSLLDQVPRESGIFSRSADIIPFYRENQLENKAACMMEEVEIFKVCYSSVSESEGFSSTSNWLLQVMWHKNYWNTDLSQVFPLAESHVTS